MKLYQILLLCLLFTYISSICSGVTASTAEECAKIELDDSEKHLRSVACCLTKISNQYMTDKDTYEKVLKRETIEA